MNKVRRLYEQFQPEHYTLWLEPDKKNMKFSGRVSIKGRKTGRPAKRLTLHAKDFKITGVKVTLKDRSGEREIKIVRTVLQKSYDELRLHADELLYPGEYIIELSFEGKITRPMNGLYPCFYKQENQEEIILATQFESHHAREVFPCIDEPEAKAIFEMTLVSPEGELVLANTPAASIDTLEGKVTTRFEPSPKMSTYLLAFVIGKLEYLEKKTMSGIVVRSYATPENIKHTDFALDVAVKCLDFYNEYFGIDYPLTKCDFVALPDFASGAMENWGLITFREQALIVDDANTSLGMKQYVANVVAHELTHQWFGNLVTMKWWNDLWLNESFASLMSYLAVDKLFPEWQVWTQFIVDEQNAALKLDSLQHTHPIIVAINHPDEIRTIFDNISYEKGASVLYMLMRFLGQDDFRKGLEHYLKKHSYGNTESHDLWIAWEQVADKPIADFMDAWTKQAGYPLLSVIVNDDNISLTQDRFYLNPKAEKEVPIWPVPLFPNIQLSDSVIGKKTNRLSFKPAAKPLVINSARPAFCRVIYDEKHVEQLKQAIKTGVIEELDRQGLISDSFEAAKAGYQSVTESLNLLEAYSDEDNVVVWDMISVNLGSIRGVMDDEELRDAMNPSIQKLIKKQYDRLGWDGKKDDSHFDKLLRPVILGLATASEEVNALNEAKKRFADRNKAAIHPDIRGIVYTTIARHGDKTEFDELLAMHNASNNSEERISLAAAITNFKQPELIGRSLEQITTENVRLQDAAYWISYSFANRYAREQTWQWLKSNWNWLKENLGGDLSFYMMPRYAARAFSDDSFLPEFKAFFEEHMSGGFVRTLNQAVETITWQSDWKRRDHEKLRRFYGLDVQPRL